MKAYFALMLYVFLTNFYLCNSQTINFGQDEIRIFNNSGYIALVSFYPVSMVMNAENNYQSNGLYSLVAGNRPSQSHSNRWDYNNGRNVNNFQFQVFNTSSVGFNFDFPLLGSFASCFGSYSYGIYKVEIRYPSAPPPYDMKVDSVLIDSDYYSEETDAPGDLGIFIEPFNVSPRFEYAFHNPSGTLIDIDALPEKKINIWESEHKN